MCKRSSDTVYIQSPHRYDTNYKINCEIHGYSILRLEYKVKYQVKHLVLYLLQFVHINWLRIAVTLNIKILK